MISCNHAPLILNPACVQEQGACSMSHPAAARLVNDDDRVCENRLESLTTQFLREVRGLAKVD